MKMSVSKSAIITTTAIVFLLLTGWVSLPVVHATTPEPAYCTTLGGTWDNVSTCTLNFPHTAISITLEVTSGTTLDIASGGDITLSGSASLLVDSGAVVNVDNSCGSLVTTLCQGLYVATAGSSLTNYGTVHVDPTLGCASASFPAPQCFGVQSYLGTITNYGTFTITGTYSCLGSANCAGVSDAGTFYNVCAGAISQASPEFLGTSIITFTGCEGSAAVTITETTTITVTETPSTGTGTTGNGVPEFSPVPVSGLLIVLGMLVPIFLGVRRFSKPRPPSR